MSREEDSFLSEESLRVMAAAAQVGNVSPEVLAQVSSSAKLHMLSLLEEAKKYRRHSRRNRMIVEDINAARYARGEEPLLTLGGDEGTGASDRVDLGEVKNAPLPPCPREPGFTFNWLVLDGVQIEPEGKKRRGKKKERARYLSERNEITEFEPLNEELKAYMRRCCKAVLSRKPAKLSRVLSSLKKDPGLEQLLGHFCAFIKEKISFYIAEEKDPQQLAALIAMTRCIVENTHFKSLCMMLDRLLSPVMSCLIHPHFSADAESSGLTQDSSSSSSSSDFHPPDSDQAWENSSREWTHWRVRDEAAALISFICASYCDTFVGLRPRVEDILLEHITKPTASLTTMYGAIKGLTALGSSAVDNPLFPHIDKIASRIAKAHKKFAQHGPPEAVTETSRCQMALLQAASLHQAPTSVRADSAHGDERKISPKVEKSRLKRRLDRSLYPKIVKKPKQAAKMPVIWTIATSKESDNETDQEEEKDGGRERSRGKEKYEGRGKGGGKERDGRRNEKGGGDADHKKEEGRKTSKRKVHNLSDMAVLDEKLVPWNICRKRQHVARVDTWLVNLHRQTI